MKKNMFYSFLLLFSLISCGEIEEPEVIVEYPVARRISSIPMPPVGKRWVLVDHLSDEFNGPVLDREKWMTTNPNWNGRAPGLFMDEQVSVEDGMLKLTGRKLDDDIIIKGQRFNIGCGALFSKATDAFYGYYECCFKANATTLSSTFWLSSRGNMYSTEGRQPEDAEKGMFNQELDICECIGRSGNFIGKNFDKSMHCNVHYWFTPEGKEKMDIKAPQAIIKRPDGLRPADGFNVYSCWWRDRSQATFYLNDAQPHTIDFYNPKNSMPFYFTEPMGVNLVMETYDQSWVQLPTDEELSDPERNTTYYDWIRSYKLIDVNEVYDSKGNADIFENHVNFTSKSSSVRISNQKIRLQYAFTSSEACQASIKIFDDNGLQVTEGTLTIYSGYGNSYINMKATEMKNGEKYYAVIYLYPKGKSVEDAYEADSFNFILKNE